MEVSESLQTALRQCPECAGPRVFERPPCPDGHGPDCPEWVCTDCGTVLLVGVIIEEPAAGLEAGAA